MIAGGIPLLLGGGAIPVPEGPGKLFFWGYGANGQLMQASANVSSPIQVASAENWEVCAIGNSNSYAIKSDGTMWGSGRGTTYGGIGDLTVVNKSSPVQIGTGYAFVAGGQNAAMAITTGSKLFTWGNGLSGRTGHGNTTHVSSPVQVGTASWTAAVMGNEHMLGIRTTGALFSWGNGGSGRLGHGGITTYNSPVQVGSQTDWTSVMCGGVHSGGLRGTDFWVWGSGTNGCLGQNSITNYSSPVQISGSWVTIALGVNTTFGIKDDGTLWATGQNNNAQLGVNDKVNRSVMTQVGTDTDWVAVFVPGDSVQASKSDGTMWAWGDGNLGALGDGTTVDKSNPVQIGSEIGWVIPQGFGGGGVVGGGVLSSP